MSTSARLDSDSVQLDAGGQAVIPLQIRNNGEIVEAYHLEVVGAPGAWASVEPSMVSVYPGTATTASVAFHPPRSAGVPAGVLPFGVRITPSEHPDEALVPEGVVRIGPFFDTAAELIPRTSRGRRAARHEIAIDNRGNVPIALRLAATDAGERLRLTVRPDELSVEPGRVAFADLHVRPAQPIWRGAPVTHQFQVAVGQPEAAPMTVEGTYLQEPILPPWTARAVAGALALALALVGVWFVLLKPTIKSAAKDAVAAPLKQAQQEARKAGSTAQTAAQNAGQAAAKAKTSEQKAQTAQQNAQKSEKTVAQVAGTVATDPFSSRLEVTVQPKASRTIPLPIPKGRALQLTDLVFENPQGDFGLLSVQKDGGTLFQLALENFRDTDFHFVLPIRAAAGSKITIKVQCNQVGKPPGQNPPPATCHPAVYFGGTVTKG